MTLVAREQDAAARTAWRAAWAALTPERYVFLDETATPTTLTPTMARAPRGQRAVGRVPRGHRPQVSWLPSLTRQGSGSSLVVNGPVDREVFDSFVTGTSVPALRPEWVLVLHWPQGGKAVLDQEILLSWTQAVASASMARSTSP
jgi:hypothetical protein